MQPNAELGMSAIASRLRTNVAASIV